MADINQTAEWVTARLTELGNATNEGLNTLVTSGNVGNYTAANVSGTVAIENGGTASTNATDARLRLGITPQNIGAVPASGGTFTGDITFDGDVAISGDLTVGGANVMDAIGTVANNLAPEYSAASTYSVGDYVLYNSALYVCTTAITTAEEWTAGHWTQVTVGDEIEYINSFFETYLSATEQTLNISFTWQQGTVNTADGANRDSATRIRNVYKRLGNYPIRIKANEGYKFGIALYTGTTYTTFVGWYNGKEVAPSSPWLKEAIINFDRSLYVRIVFAKDNDTSITTAEAQNLIFYTAVDTTLLKQGVPADAASVGELVTSLTDLANAAIKYTLIDATLLKSGDDLNNIDSGSYYTRSAAESAAVLNAPFTTIAFRLFAFQSTSEGRNIQIVVGNRGVDAGDEQFSGIYVRRRITQGGSWGAWTTLATNLYVQNQIANLGATTIRVMQYNIGKFRWGYVDGLEEHGLTEEQYQEKLKNYKRLFGKYQPDLLGLQECITYMDKAETHVAKEVLLNGVFSVVSPNSYYNERLIECELCACGNLTGIGRISVRDTADTERTWFRTGVLTVGGRTIKVATGALSSAATPTQRAEQLAYLIEQEMASYDYAIIMSDLNSVYWQDETTGELIENGSLEVVLDKAAEYGFAPCQGKDEYWGATVTYVHHPGVDYGNVYSCLDNILVKGNIKIRNFEVLTDEYSALSSDHIPVVADLYIY